MVDTFQLGYNESASNQCSILSDSQQCVSSFSIDTVASTWYNPGQLPSGFPGTAPLSDTTQHGSLTSAPDPYTFSIFPSYITVITPAPYNKKNAEATGSGGSGSGSGSGSGDSTTGTGDAAATATDKSDPSASKGASNNLVAPLSAKLSGWGLSLYTVACVLFGAMLIA